MDLTKLGLMEIRSMLEERGYTDASCITAVRYVSTISGTLTYEIDFYDIIAGETDKGYVYVFIDSCGKLVTDY